MEIQQVAYHEIVNIENFRQLKNYFDQIWRIYQSIKCGMVEKLQGELKESEERMKNSEKVGKEVECGLFPQQNCSGYAQCLQQYLARVAREQLHHLQNCLQLLQHDLNEDQEYYSTLDTQLVQLLENELCQLVLTDIKYAQMKQKYENKSVKTESNVQKYQKRQQQAKQIYNLSNMENNWRRTEKKITNIKGLEDDLRKLIRALHQLKDDCCQLFLLFMPQFKEFFQMSIMKLSRLSSLNLNYQQKYHQLTYKYFCKHLATLELQEITTCLPFPQQFRIIQQKVKTAVTSTKSNQYALDELVWPDFLKHQVEINDDNLVNYTDWAQTYLDKLQEITKER